MAVNVGARYNLTKAVLNRAAGTEVQVVSIDPEEMFEVLVSVDGSKFRVGTEELEDKE